MKIYSLIYTKASPKKSPWGKSDFHTLFFPKELMVQEDVFEIEKRIHFPGIGDFKQKETVFFLKLKERMHLVVLLIRSLPDDKDEFGRGGMFLCQGFIFPPELWHKSPMPLTLMELIKPYIFENRQQAFLSPLVSWETGDFAPIEISEGKINPFLLPSLNSKFEWKVLRLITRLASSNGEGLSLFFKGDPKNISEFLNRIVAYIPDALKIYVGWDSAFDYGNLTFFPLKIVGFSIKHPVGGNAIDIDLASEVIKYEFTQDEILLPKTPYEKWLNQCRSEVTSKANIERAFALSLLLTDEKESTIKNISETMPCFISANSQQIEKAFLERTEKVLGSEVTKYVADTLPLEEKLALIIHRLPFDRLASILEKVILRNRLTPENLNTTLPESVRIYGSIRLKLIFKVWNGEPLNLNDLNALNKEEKRELIQYFLLAGWADTPWVVHLLKADKKLFEWIFSHSETRSTLERIVQNTISQTEHNKKVVTFFIREAIRQNVLFDLFTQRISPMELLDFYFKDGYWQKEEMKQLISWFKKQKFSERRFDYARAFLDPQQGIPTKIMNDTRIKYQLLDCLINFYRFKPEALNKLGFSKEEMDRIGVPTKSMIKNEKIRKYLNLVKNFKRKF